MRLSDAAQPLPPKVNAYNPGVVTRMTGVVSPVDQRNDTLEVTELASNKLSPAHNAVSLPRSSAVAERNETEMLSEPAQPFTVTVTAYVPAATAVSKGDVLPSF